VILPDESHCVFGSGKADLFFSWRTVPFKTPFKFLVDQRDTQRSKELWFSCGDPSPPLARLGRFLFLILLLIKDIRLECNDEQKGNQFSEVDCEFSILGCRRWRCLARGPFTLCLESLLRLAAHLPKPVHVPTLIEKTPTQGSMRVMAIFHQLAQRESSCVKRS
jgi:hypothetical protein